MAKKSTLKVGDLVESINEPAKEYKVKFDETEKIWFCKPIDKVFQFKTPAALLEYYRKVTESPALRLVSILLWKNRETSENRLSKQLYSLINVAVEARMRFDLDDLTKIVKMSRWWKPHEGFYQAAIEAKNVSAQKAFEKWKNRAPFMFAGEKLFEGKQFIWQGLRVKVTSFSEDGARVIACQQNEIYNDEQPYGKTKTDRVFKLAREELSEQSELNVRLALAFNAVKEKVDPNNSPWWGVKKVGGEEIFCDACAKQEWGKAYGEGVEYVYADVLHLACQKCRKILRTQPSHETLVRELENFAFDPTDDKSLRAMLQFFALAHEQPEKILSLCAGIVDEYKNRPSEEIE